MVLKLFDLNIFNRNSGRKKKLIYYLTCDFGYQPKALFDMNSTLLVLVKPFFFPLSINLSSSQSGQS